LDPGLDDIDAGVDPIAEDLPQVSFSAFDRLSSAVITTRIQAVPTNQHNRTAPFLVEVGTQ
jgi:hypothetical protein